MIDEFTTDSGCIAYLSSMLSFFETTTVATTQLSIVIANCNDRKMVYIFPEKNDILYYFNNCKNKIDFLANFLQILFYTMVLKQLIMINSSWFNIKIQRQRHITKRKMEKKIMCKDDDCVFLLFHFRFAMQNITLTIYIFC